MLGTFSTVVSPEARRTLGPPFFHHLIIAQSIRPPLVSSKWKWSFNLSQPFPAEGKTFSFPLRISAFPSRSTKDITNIPEPPSDHGMAGAIVVLCWASCGLFPNVFNFLIKLDRVGAAVVVTVASAACEKLTGQADPFPSLYAHFLLTLSCFYCALFLSSTFRIQSIWAVVYELDSWFRSHSAWPHLHLGFGFPVS